MSTNDDLPVLAFPSRQAWTEWLTEQHIRSNGIWLKIAKKASGIDTVSYSEALDVALCFGWIDGQKRPFDGEYFLQRFTPRRPRSKWSQNNRDRVAALIESGEMQAAGLREVERAKSDGRWDAAYGGRSTMTVPEDLQQALDENQAARETFAALNGNNRFAILYRLHDAKRPETRARRLETFIAMLAEGKKLLP